MGLGAVLMYAHVGIFTEGLCASVVCISIVEVVIESIRNIEIVRAIILFFSVFIFVLSLKIVISHLILSANKVGSPIVRMNYPSVNRLQTCLTSEIADTNYLAKIRTVQMVCFKPTPAKNS